MLSSRRLGAFFSGLLLYCSAMLLATPLSLTPLPYMWYRVAGLPDSLPGQLWRAFMYALPLFVGASLWVYLTLRQRHRARRAAALWCFSGIGLAWFGWLVYGVIDMGARTQAHRGGAAALLLTSKLPPFYGLQNTLAVIAGALLALWLLPRLAGSHQQGSRKTYRSGQHSLEAGLSSFQESRLDSRQHEERSSQRSSRSGSSRSGSSRGSRGSSRSRSHSSKAPAHVSLSLPPAPTAEASAAMGAATVPGDIVGDGLTEVIGTKPA